MKDNEAKDEVAEASAEESRDEEEEEEVAEENTDEQTGDEKGGGSSPALAAGAQSLWGLTIEQFHAVDDEELSLAPLPGPSARASPSAAPWLQRQLPCPGGKKRRADESEGAAAASVGADSKGSKKRDRNKRQGGDDDVKKEVKRMRLSPGFRLPEHYCTFIGGWLSPP